MSSRLATLAVSALVAWGLSLPANLCSADEAADANADSRKAKASVSAEMRIAAALDRPTTWEILDEPLTDVMDYIQETHDIAVVIDRVALEDFGIGVDTPVSFTAQDMRLRSILRHTLGALDLTYRISDDAPWITTPEEAEAELAIKTYQLGDLIRVSQASGESTYNYHSIINVITNCIATDSWENVGGPGTVEGIYGSLVVSQTGDVHDRVGLLLAGYRTVLQQLEQSQDATVPVIVDDHDGLHDRIRAALDAPITLEFIEVPIADVVGFIANHSEITVLLDVRALEDYGIGLDVPITANVKNVPLRKALRRVLHELDLTFGVRDEALVITTEEEEESELSVVLYPVQDLVSAADSDSSIGQRREFDRLIDVITTTIQPDAWDEVGGAGSIVPVAHPPMLAISQTDGVHKQTRELMHSLRSAKRGTTRFK